MAHACLIDRLCRLERTFDGPPPAPRLAKALDGNANPTARRAVRDERRLRRLLARLCAARIGANRQKLDGLSAALTATRADALRRR